MIRFIGREPKARQGRLTTKDLHIEEALYCLQVEAIQTRQTAKRSRRSIYGLHINGPCHQQADCTRIYQKGRILQRTYGSCQNGRFYRGYAVRKRTGAQDQFVRYEDTCRKRLIEAIAIWESHTKATVRTDWTFVNWITESGLTNQSSVNWTVDWTELLTE